MLVEESTAKRIIEQAVVVREAFAASGRPIIFVRTHHRQDPRTGEIVDNKSPFGWRSRRSRCPAWASFANRWPSRARR